MIIRLIAFIINCMYKIFTIILIGFILLFSNTESDARNINNQEFIPGYYFVGFTDKNFSPYRLNAPSEFLTEESILRRHRYGIGYNYYDLPVSPVYIDYISEVVDVLYSSKWFNSVLAKINNQDELNAVKEFSFYKDIIFLKPFDIKAEAKSPKHQQDFYSDQLLLKDFFYAGVEKSISFDNESSFKYYYGFMREQVEMLNGQALHKNGFWGEGMSVALFDAGFLNLNQLDAFNHLWENERLLGYFDLVEDDEHIFNSHRHGTLVLSTMAAISPGQYAGAAPEAFYWLFQTEDGKSEYLIEEVNWLKAAEMADSLGVYIINSSLGYSEFDLPEQNHTYEDLDGNTTIVARAANYASERGMIVINSAGNYGSSPWKYIASPADSHGAIATGALTATGDRAAFSSFGPTTDGRVKPDVMALGYQVAIINVEGMQTLGSGTSFSAPIISALTACLWQEFSEKDNFQIMKALRESSNKYLYPDSEFGFGTPDFAKARLLLKNNFDIDDFYLYSIIPNPISPNSYIPILSHSEISTSVDIYNLSGQKISSEVFIIYQGMNKISPFTSIYSILSSGVYIVKIRSGEEISIIKAIKA
jgi:serine protease AprX